VGIIGKEAEVRGTQDTVGQKLAFMTISWWVEVSATDKSVRWKEKWGPQSTAEVWQSEKKPWTRPWSSKSQDKQMGKWRLSEIIL